MSAVFNNFPKTCLSNYGAPSMTKVEDYVLFCLQLKIFFYSFNFPKSLWSITNIALMLPFNSIHYCHYWVSLRLILLKIYLPQCLSHRTLLWYYKWQCSTMSTVSPLYMYLNCFGKTSLIMHQGVAFQQIDIFFYFIKFWYALCSKWNLLEHFLQIRDLHEITSN